MAAEQSQFSRLPKKQLVRIVEKLDEEGFDTNNPYGDYEENYEILKNIASFFSMVVNDEDVQFFAKFMDINDDLLSKILEPNGDKSLIEKLEIPIAKTYQLNYEVWGNCSYSDFLKQDLDSYDKNWVIESATQQMYDGNLNLWDGTNTRDTVYENFEEAGNEFNAVIEKNNDSNVTTESLLNRLVIKNTSEVVSSLDKQTLLKLKQIIESRLRSL